MFPVSTMGVCRDTIPYISLDKFRDGIHHWNLFSPLREYSRYDTNDVLHIADNLLAYQNPDGGWPKNIDWLGILDADKIKMSLPEKDRRSTFDNRNIFSQVEYLSKVFILTGEEKYRLGAMNGLQYILDSQHPNGGWRGADVDAITFNDDVMTGIMELLLDIQYDQKVYGWIPTLVKIELTRAFNKALSVTLKCQIEVHGTKTAWCQQHDHLTFIPVQARSYELPSICAKESTGIVLLLMKIRNPGDSVILAIDSAIKWFRNSAIRGYRLERIPIPEVKYYETTVDYDRVMIPDSDAPPVWARFYDIQTNTPFLCRRDGTIVYSLQEVSFERRIGYEWYGYWPKNALDAYGKWEKH